MTNAVDAMPVNVTRTIQGAGIRITVIDGVTYVNDAPVHSEASTNPKPRSVAVIHVEPEALDINPLTKASS